MMQKAIAMFVSSRLKGAVLLIIASLSSVAVYAQDLDSDMMNGANVPRLASALFLNSDLVALGTFGEPVEIGDDPYSLLRSRELTISLTLINVFKGPVNRGDVVQVRLRSDMLGYPGEDVSRYQKRFELMQSNAEELARESAAPELELQFQRGEITRSERDRVIRGLDVENGQLISESRRLMDMQRRVGTSHGQTFYDLGGKVIPDTLYLVALNSVDGNVELYFVDDTISGFNINWGELADALSSEIKQQFGADASDN